MTLLAIAFPGHDFRVRLGTATGRVLAVAVIAVAAMPNDAGAQNQTPTPVDAGHWLAAGAVSAIAVPREPAAEAIARTRTTVDFPRERRVVPRDSDSRLGWEIRPGEAVALDDPAHSAADDTQGPRIRNVSFWEGSRQLSDTYVLGNEINVVISFDEEVVVQGGPSLVLTIGSEMREAAVADSTGLWFKYRVQSSDYDPNGLSIAADAIRLNGGSVKDLAGNDADLNLDRYAITNHPDHKVDGRRDPPPAVRAVEILSSPSRGDTYVRGDRIDVQVQFDEDVIVGARPTLALTIGTATRQAVDEYARPSREPRLVSLLFSYDVQAADVDTNGISIEANALRASVRDGTGQAANLSLGRHAIVDDPAHKVDGRRDRLAVVTRVQVDPPERGGDTYRLRDIIQVQIYFSRGVVVTGVPRLALTIGAATRHAAYYATDEFGEGRVFFQYEVQATDLDDDGLSIPADALTLNGGTIRDISGQDVELGLGRHAVTDEPSRKVDGGAMPAAAVRSVLISSRPQHGDTYGLGETIDVLVLFDAEFELTRTQGRSMELALTIGTETRYAEFQGCVTEGQSEFLTLCEKYNIGVTFTYDVQRDDVDDDGISVAPAAVRLNGWRLRDRNGNDVDLDLGRHAIVNNPRHKVAGGADHAPAITSVYISSRPQRGQTYGMGEEIAIHVNFDEKVRVSGEPTLALTIGTAPRQATYWRPPPDQDFAGALFLYDVQATDHDADGVSIGPDALRLNGGSIRDTTGTDVESDLGRFAIADHPDHKVDGTVNHRPRVVEASILSRPQHGDTYRRGENVRVRVVFDEPLTWEQPLPDRLSLALTIGAETRLARLTHYLLRGSFNVFGFGFAYEVQRTDYDKDGLGIGKTALRLEGVIADRDGNEADLTLGSHVIGNHPAHRVNGGDIRAVGRLPPLELLAGEEAATVDLARAFRGTIVSYAAMSSNPDVATVSVAGAVLTVVPGARGTATVEVTARNGPERATQTFAVTVLPAVEAVGTLPPLELVAGGEAATVDLAQAFRGAIRSYAAVSSNPDVAEVTTTDAVLTVTPGAEGMATIEATARSRTESATQEFTVTVVTDPAEVRVLEHTLAAFGRSVLASVTMTVEGRFEAAPGRTTVTMAGRELPIGTGPAGAWGGYGGWPQPGVAAGGGADARIAAAPAGHQQAQPFPGTRSAGRLTGDHLLGGSHFLVPLNGGQPDDDAGGPGGRPAVRWTVWGTGDLQSFGGEPEHDTHYDGNLRAGHVGIDVGGERWLAGAVVSRSAGQAAYGFSGAATGSGQLTTKLTSVQPYLRWTPREGTAIWTILGTGGGEVENVRRHVGGRQEQSALSMRLGVVGARRTLAAVGRLKFAARGDAGVVRLETGDGEEVVDGLTATIQRYRLGIETAHTTRWANGATLTPFVELGGRHDGGAGQTGNGLEVTGGVRLAHPGSGFGLEARGRMLVLHTATGYRERGMNVTALLTPGGTDGRGWSVAVTPGWGAPVDAADAMWREQAFEQGRLPRVANETASVDAQVAYGLVLRAGHVLTPFSTLGVRGDEHRRLRVGLRLTGAADTPTPLHVELAGERIDTGWGRVDHRLGLMGVLSY